MWSAGFLWFRFDNLWASLKAKIGCWHTTVLLILFKICRGRWGGEGKKNMQRWLWQVTLTLLSKSAADDWSNILPLSGRAGAEMKSPGTLAVFSLRWGSQFVVLYMRVTAPLLLCVCRALSQVILSITQGPPHPHWTNYRKGCISYSLPPLSRKFQEQLDGCYPTLPADHVVLKKKQKKNNVDDDKKD